MSDALNTKPKLSVIIVNYNGGELVMICLASLYRNPPTCPFEVLVVDNCSVDNSAAAIARDFSAARLLKMDSNQGLTKAFNRGIANSLGEYILSLDNDTVVNPGVLDAMVHLLDETPEAGACGAKLINPDGTPQHTARRFPNAWNGLFGRGSLLTKWFPNNFVSQRYLMREQESLDVPYEVDSLSAACLMVRRSAIDQVGPLDENFFVYWCDTDWCFRIKAGGWRILSLPRHKIIHNENSRTRHRKGRRIRGILDFHKGVYRFYRKHYIRSSWNPMNLVAMVGLTTRAGLLIAADEVKRLLRQVPSRGQ